MPGSFGVITGHTSLPRNAYLLMRDTPLLWFSLLLMSGDEPFFNSVDLDAGIL
jgi:hypothetical protein